MNFCIAVNSVSSAKLIGYHPMVNVSITHGIVYQNTIQIHLMVDKDIHVTCKVKIVMTCTVLSQNIHTGTAYAAPELASHCST